MNDSNNATSDYARQATANHRLFPHGFAGRICEYLYNAAPRPTEEAAIAGTLGLLAGVNGGSYSVSNPPTGLNLYVALVMKSAIGKESMSRAVWLNEHACSQMS